MPPHSIRDLGESVYEGCRDIFDSFDIVSVSCVLLWCEEVTYSNNNNNSSSDSSGGSSGSSSGSSSSSSNSNSISNDIYDSGNNIY